MRKNFVLALIACLVILISWGVQHRLQSDAGITTTASSTHASEQSPNTYTTKVAGLTFSYFAGAEGYVLTNREKDGNDFVSLITTITLMTAKDAADLNDRINTEGPPTLTLSIYSNETNESLDTWVTNHPLLSNNTQKTSEITQRLIGGERALSYTTDGLYLNQVTVIAHDNYILVATGAYYDTSSKTYLDYEPWLGSFTFKK